MALMGNSHQRHLSNHPEIPANSKTPDPSSALFKREMMDTASRQINHCPWNHAIDVFWGK
jgi:hypothetical protein